MPSVAIIVVVEGGNMFPYIHIQGSCLSDFFSKVVCISGSQPAQHSTSINPPSLQFYLGYCEVALNSISMVDVSLLWAALCSGFTGIAYITCGTTESLVVGSGILLSRLIFVLLVLYWVNGEYEYLYMGWKWIDRGVF